MSMYYEFRLCGSGGQGLMLMGDILAHCVEEDSHVEVLLSKSYGPETRGGVCKSDLIVADHDISYPEVTRPDLVVAMSQKAFDKYCGSAHDCTILLDSAIRVPEKVGCKYIRYPFIETAKKQLGDEQLSNIIITGFLSALCSILDRERMLRAIDDRFSGNAHLDAYHRAFEIGHRAMTGERLF